MRLIAGLLQADFWHQLLPGTSRNNQKRGNEMNRNLLFGVAVVTGILAFAIYFVTVYGAQKSTASVPIAPQQVVKTAPQPAAAEIETFPTLEATHFERGSKGTYNSNPPTSGQHFGSTKTWGAYAGLIDDEFAVHSLEHGGIWISYPLDLDTKSVRKLRKIPQKYPQAVILAPRQKNDGQIVVASWGRLMRLDAVDSGVIDAYIRTYVNDSPEKLASLEKPVETGLESLALGKPFPSFSLTDVDGRKINLNSLAGKPVIIWFTTGWCVPCQIGAKKVAKLDDELGGKAFNVVVVFVDPNEEEIDLRDWKRKFAKGDWQVAFDSQVDPVTQKVALQYLDSKYLVDDIGILRDTDFRIADGKYLATIRDVVEMN